MKSGLRLRHVLQPREVTDCAHLPVLSVYRDHGVVPKESRSDNYNKTPVDLARYQEVRVGDLVINKMKAWQGSLAVSDFQGIVSPDYQVCSVMPSVHGRFLHYLLRSLSMIAEYGARSKGIRPAQWRLYWEDLADIPVALPNFDEQRRIARFLDAETARIDNLISLRLRQVQLIKARINQIGDSIIAAHRTGVAAIDAALDRATWKSSKLAHACSILPGFAFASDDYVQEGDGVRLLRGVNVGVDSIDWTETYSWDVDAKPVPPLFYLADGDVVIGMDRPWIKGGARVATIQSSDLPALLLQRVARLRPKGGVAMQYVKLGLRSTHFRQAIESELTGVSVPHLSADQIGGFRLSLPDIETQRNVSSLYATEEEAAAGLNAAFEKQVVLIQERRQALITAAVTGQFEVATGRGADLS